MFCKIIAGELPAKKVYEDDLVVAFHDIHPRGPVHVLIVPREHIVSTNQTGEAHRDALGQLFLAARQVAERMGVARTGYRLLVNNGPHAGQEVMHLHMHLLDGRPLGPMVVSS